MNLLKKRTRNNKGFTLIELIVVIAILGILAAIAIPRFTNVTNSAKDKAALADQKVVVAAVQMHMAANNGSLPANNDAVKPYLQGDAIPSTVTLDYTVAGQITVKATSPGGGTIAPIILK